MTRGFNQHKSLKDTSSVCGGYISPLQLVAKEEELGERPGVDFICVQAESELNSLKYYFWYVKGIAEGFSTLDPLWQKVQIYLDIFPNVEDYLSASACA